MNFWNPQNKAVLYFHVCRRDDDFYIRVNVHKQEVWKLYYAKTLKNLPKERVGLYKIKWNTFITGICSDLNQKSRAWTRHCENADGKPRTWVKYTTANQWVEAIKKLITEIYND